MAKGQQFEREVCRQLSLWYSNGTHDDWFWRTSNSGGRATVRGKSGKRTSGQYGDIAAIDPRGVPLIHYFTFELKCGYNRASLFDLIDRPKRSAEPIWQEWIEKAMATAKQAGSKAWMIIHKRDRKEAVVVMPIRFMPYSIQRGSIRFDALAIAITTLSKFLTIHPHTFTEDQ